MHYRVNAGCLPLNHWTQDPQVGGGRIIGEGCHFVDFLTFLAGAAPVSVSAQALPDDGKYREDNVSMTFTFPDGSHRRGGLPRQRRQILPQGARGGLLRRADRRAGRFPLAGNYEGWQAQGDSPTGQDKGWKREMAAFAEAIREGGEPPIPYEQLIGVTQATFAAVESIRSGQPIGIE